MLASQPKWNFQLLTACAAILLSSIARADYYYGDLGYSPRSRSNGPIISLELDEKKSRELEMRVAARENRVLDLRRLIRTVTDVNGCSEEGDTALMAASRSCATEAVHVLIENHVDVNARDSHRRTALMYAVMEGCLDVTKLLLESPQIALKVKDDDHLSAFDYAQEGTALDVDGPAVTILNLVKSALNHSQAVTEKRSHHHALKLGLNSQSS
jgi:ankyrin repeat protein